MTSTRKTINSFINEFVSEEDITRYDLDKVWDQYHPSAPWRGVHRHIWTVDKSSNRYLMLLGYGREELGNQATFLLWWSGDEIFIKLNKYGFCSFKEGKGQAIWDLVEINIPERLKGERYEIIDCLKNALLAYGYQGASRVVGNYQVNFKF